MFLSQEGFEQNVEQTFIIFTETIMHLVYPLKCCIVFYFSWDYRNTKDKLETMVMLFFFFWRGGGGGGVGVGVGNKVHYGLCENSEWYKSLPAFGKTHIKKLF